MSQTKSVIALFLVLFTQYAFASHYSPSLITVVGNGATAKPADAIVITVGVSLKNECLKELQKELDKQLYDIIDYLKCQGICENDIQTSNVDLQIVYPSDYTKPHYYTATQSITFTLRKLEKYDEIIFGLFCVGISGVENTVFIIDNEDALRQEARKSAVKDAEGIAALLAKELDVHVGKVYSVVDQGTTTSSAEGVVVVSSSVQVQFYIDYYRKKY